MGEKRGQQPVSQAEAERQQILNEMKKKNPLLTDSSWIRQQASNAHVTHKGASVPPMRRYSPRRGEELQKPHLCVRCAGSGAFNTH